MFERDATDAFSFPFPLRDEIELNVSCFSFPVAPEMIDQIGSTVDIFPAGLVVVTFEARADVSMAYGLNCCKRSVWARRVVRVDGPAVLGACSNRSRLALY